MPLCLPFSCEQGKHVQIISILNSFTNHFSVLILFVDYLQETVKRMRLRVFSIVDALKKKCEGTSVLANVHIVSK